MMKNPNSYKYLPVFNDFCEIDRGWQINCLINNGLQVKVRLIYSVKSKDHLESTGKCI